MMALYCRDADIIDPFFNHFMDSQKVDCSQTFSFIQSIQHALYVSMLISL